MTDDQKFWIRCWTIAGAVFISISAMSFARSAYQSSLVASHAHPMEFACADSGAERMHPACLSLAKAAH